MGLSQTQNAIITRAQSAGGSKQGIVLDNETCAYLVGVIAHDLGLLEKMSHIPTNLPSFF